MEHYILITDNNQILSAFKSDEVDNIPSNAIKITKAQFVSLNRNFDIAHEYINGKVVKSTKQDINDIIQIAINTANDACRSKIIYNFTSKVLGAEHSYTNTIEDQINLTNMFNASMSGAIKCANIAVDKPVFEYKMHTIEQIRQLHSDMIQHKMAALSSFDDVKHKLSNLLTNGSSSIKVVTSQVKAILATQK